ncbi:hypothetical protein [Enterococcus sp. DIV0756]|uniref:hypothetical protein n=1 Tax=Enterococcus sp. DIV0756 TaxID=2774636 RepID=UPI003F29B9AF
MKNSGKATMLLFLLVFLLFPVQALAEEESNTALYSGTYFPNLTVNDQSKKRILPLKVTILSKNGEINKEKQVGIDGRDFEYPKKENLLGLKKEKLIELAELRIWSLEDGKPLKIDECKIETKDYVESQITFYNFEKNISKTIRAYKSGDEIYASKKYTNVEIQKYHNISGGPKERDWNIEYRSLFTYMILLLSVCPVILVIVLIVFIYLQTTELNKIIVKKVKKKHLLWLILPTLFTFGGEARANEYNLQEVFLTQEQATQLKEENQLEAYLIEKSGIQDQIEEKSSVEIDTTELVAGLELPRKRSVKVYHSRTLIVGDYENYTAYAAILFCAMIVLPLIYFLNKRIKTE